MKLYSSDADLQISDVRLLLYSIIFFQEFEQPGTLCLYNGTGEVVDAVHKTLGLEPASSPSEEGANGQVKFTCRSETFPDGPWQSGISPKTQTTKKPSLTARIRSSIDNSVDNDDSTTTV